MEVSGFTYLEFPREGILPLMLLKEKEDSIIGNLISFIKNQGKTTYALNDDLFGLFPPETRFGILPEVGPIYDAASHQGNLNAKHAVNAGFNIGLSKINLENRHNCFLRYEYFNIKIQSVKKELTIDDYLNKNKPKQSLLNKAKQNMYFVVMHALITNNFSVELVLEDKAAGTFDIKDYVKGIEATARIEAEKSDTNKLYFSSDNTYLTFAVKANRIFYHKKEDAFSLDKTGIRKVLGDSDLDTELL